jgi:hypothetical protein
MERIFIARSFYVKNERGDRHIDQEGIFDSYNMALRFVEHLCDPDETDRYMIEIVSYLINSFDPWNNEELWYFDKSGSFVRKLEDTKEDRMRHKTSYTGNFNLGDIVNIRAFPFNEYSHMMIDMLGVVSQRPMHLTERIKIYEPEDELTCEYTVDYITSEGYVSHDHINENGLELWLNEIPSELAFLRRLSEHYQGKDQIKENILRDLLNSRVFVKNVLAGGPGNRLPGLEAQED